VAVEVVAAAADATGSGTHHGRLPFAVAWQAGQVLLLVRDGVPDGEADRPGAEPGPRGLAEAEEEDATVAEGGRGDEASAPSAGLLLVGVVLALAEDAQQRGRAVELVEPAAEGIGGDEAPPEPADQGGADHFRFPWSIRTQDCDAMRSVCMPGLEVRFNNKYQLDGWCPCHYHVGPAIPYRDPNGCSEFFLQLVPVTNSSDTEPCPSELCLCQCTSS
jgi:hypothetical protein